MYEESQATLNYKPSKPQQPAPPPTNLLKARAFAGREKRTPLYRQLEGRIRSRMQKVSTQGNESRMSVLDTHSSQFLGREGRIMIRREDELREYEAQVLQLWEHYELLSRILELIHEDITNTKHYIAKYREAACSGTFEFVREKVGAICEGGRSKKECEFLKRLKKGVITSRLLEHLSIVLLALKFYSE